MDRYSIVEGYYWWLIEHHNGQSSREYARLSRITGYYSPSPIAHGPRDEAMYVYQRLCVKAGCAHEAREEN